MLRILVHALAVLHLGPGIAFAVLAFGCDGVEPLLGRVCAVGTMKLFVGVTLASWLVLGLVSAVVIRRGERAEAAAGTD